MDRYPTAPMQHAGFHSVHSPFAPSNRPIERAKLPFVAKQLILPSLSRYSAAHVASFDSGKQDDDTLPLVLEIPII